MWLMAALQESSILSGGQPVLSASEQQLFQSTYGTYDYMLLQVSLS